MIRTTGRNWWIFGLCAAVLVAAMLWLTAVMLRLDRDKTAARADSDHQIALSKALWRMDSWLAPQLAQEAARPYYVYQAYYPQRQAYTKVLSEIEAGEVQIQSPLLSFRSELFVLHFQLDRETLTSPQVPEGNWRDLTEANSQAPLDLGAKTAQLARLRSRLRNGISKLDSRYLAAAACVPPIDSKTTKSGMPDYVSRARSMDQARQSAAANVKWQARQPVEPGGVTIGPLLPIWLDGASPAEPWLLFVRQVQRDDRSLFQGMLADWPRLRSALLEQIGDPFATAGPAASLLPVGDVLVTPGDHVLVTPGDHVPVTQGDHVLVTQSDHVPVTQSDHVLATVPARLTAVKQPEAHRVSGGSVLVLGVAWGGLLVSLIAVAFALHSTNQFGQRQARFASAVTHELRTPLTTFRMYSEMLAEGMVSDPAQRTAYLDTLKAEADRLARLVENVLAYARIEDGRFNTHPERIALSALLERVRPFLEQRTRDTDQHLEIEVHNGVELEVDVDAITQILFNLVDNACKYAIGATDPRIEVTANSSGPSVTITVRDHGPGIPANLRAAIFRPFERAARGPADNEIPGVGLGLALARALAKDLGGQLELVEGSGSGSGSGSGAAFRLTIPRATRPRNRRSGC